MVTKTEKLRLMSKRRKFIRSNSKLSANAIHKKWKGTKLALRRSDVFALVRGVRKLRSPTKRKRERSVPKKFRKPIKPVPAEAPPVSEYTVAKIKDARGNEYWIKYSDEESLNRQLIKLGNFYQTREDTFQILETKPYTEFVAEEFKF